MHEEWCSGTSLTALFSAPKSSIPFSHPLLFPNSMADNPPDTNTVSSHTTPTQDTLYVFGGSYDAEDGSGVAFSSDLHAYDIETGFWTRKLPSPLQPCARAGHCMISVGSSFYVICGRTTIDDETTFLADVFVYDTWDKIWSPVRTAGPNPVSEATSPSCSPIFPPCRWTTFQIARRILLLRV